MSLIRDTSGTRLTGPEHYAAAESGIHQAQDSAYNSRHADDASWLRADVLAEAQVHATLALAAATALAHVGQGPVAKQWREPGGPLDPRLLTADRG